MPIPDRWRPVLPDPAEIERFSELCDRIENQVEGYEQDLATWNARASREYREIEFRKYYGSVDKETFVTEALLRTPAFDPQVTFEELVAVTRAIAEGEGGELLDEAVQSYLMEVLDVNLLGAGISDLIYWPNHWFGDEDANPNDYELDYSQMVRYALLRSGREVPGCPVHPELPYPLPRP